MEGFLEVLSLSASLPQASESRPHFRLIDWRLKASLTKPLQEWVRQNSPPHPQLPDASHRQPDIVQIASGL